MPGQIAPNRLQRPARQPDRRCHHAQVVAHDDEVCGIDRDVGARADRQAKVAAASAGASFTPSPTIATHRPSSCRRRMIATFSAGSAPATTSPIPIDAPTALAVVSLSPVKSTQRNPSACS